MWYAHIYNCDGCKKPVKGGYIVDINGKEMLLCLRCFLSHSLHETIRDMLQSGREEDIRDVLRFLRGINDLIEDNPLVQGIRHLIDVWAMRYPRPLSLSDADLRNWYYKVSIKTVVNYLIDEQIFKISAGDQLEPGALLEKLLKLHATNKSIYRDLVKAVTGLATVRFLVDPDNPKLRSVYATIQAIANCLNELDPYYIVKGYKCRLCGAELATRYEAENHVKEKHSPELSLEEYMGDAAEGGAGKYVEEIRGDAIGYLCRQTLFLQSATAYGVHGISKYLRRLIIDGVLLPVRGDDAIIEKGGEMYVVVDPSWIRVRERMRSLERKIIRHR
jgi:hypothetical protein